MFTTKITNSAHLINENVKKKKSILDHLTEIIFNIAKP